MLEGAKNLGARSCIQAGRQRVHPPQPLSNVSSLKCDSCEIKCVIIHKFLVTVFCFQFSDRSLIVTLCFWLQNLPTISVHRPSVSPPDTPFAQHVLFKKNKLVETGILHQLTNDALFFLFFC